MTEFFSDYGFFLAKTLTVVLAILFLMSVAISNAAKGRKELEKGALRVTHLNKDIEDLCRQIKKEVIDKPLLKRQLKAEKKAEKKKAKEQKAAAKRGGGAEEPRKRIYVMDFHGDTKASEVEDLRKVITAVLEIARPEHDEVLLRLESPGGMVHSYGLAASQLNRIRKHSIPLTICVDKVAASGGYMMACLGDRIVSGPFAYVGSIGVVLQLPNFHRFLQDIHVDYEMVTAGEYKRTLTLFGENTEKDRQKVTEDIQDAHNLFKDFIRQHRPALAVDEVATGETWFGTRALEKGLVDEIKTSDECIVEACEEADVYHVRYEHKRHLGEKISHAVEYTLDNAFQNWAQRTGKNRFFS